jgi:hypothetical protein
MRKLVDRVPAEVREQLEAAVMVLEQYGPLVANALDILQQATFDANLAAEMRVGSLAPAELAEPTDAEMDALEAALGIDRGWAAAFRVADVVRGV